MKTLYLNLITGRVEEDRGEKTAKGHYKPILFSDVSYTYKGVYVNDPEVMRAFQRRMKMEYFSPGWVITTLDIQNRCWKVHFHQADKDILIHIPDHIWDILVTKLTLAKLSG